MATRRIARGRGGSPIPVIILSVIVVGLLASTIILGMKVGALETDKDAVTKTLDAAKVSATSLEKKHLDYERLVGLDLESAALEFAKKGKQLTEKAKITPPGGEPLEAGPFKNLIALLDGYADRTAALESIVADREGELKKAREARDKAEKEIAEKEKEGLQKLEDQKKVTEGLRTENDDLKAKLDKIQKDLTAAVDSAKTEKIDLTKQVNEWKKLAEVRLKEIEELKRRNKELLEPPRTSGGLLQPTTAEPVDGKMLSVDADGQHVMINIGRRDWVALGMEFRVFDNPSPETRKEKGLIQVRQVYDDIAQCKVLKQDPIDPLLPGMVLVNPAFSRGKTLEFVFEGVFKDPNIERALSRYPCRIAKEVTSTTDYLILGQGDYKPGQKRPEDSKNHQLASGPQKSHVTIMTERDLLRYLGETD